MAKGERGTVWVAKEYGGQMEGGPRELEVRTFPEGVELAHVRAGFGLTISMGNYEFARVDAQVTLPCVVEEIPGAFTEAWRIAENELSAQIQDLKHSHTTQVFLAKQRTPRPESAESDG